MASQAMATGMLEATSRSEDGGLLLGKRVETTASTWNAWRGATSASSLCFCLAPGFRVQILEFKSTPLPGPQLPYSHCERVDKMSQGLFCTIRFSVFSPETFQVVSLDNFLSNFFPHLLSEVLRG